MVIRLHKWKLLNDGSNLESKYSSIHIVVYAVCRRMASFAFVLCHIQWENLVPMLFGKGGWIQVDIVISKNQVLIHIITCVQIFLMT